MVTLDLKSYLSNWPKLRDRKQNKKGQFSIYSVLEPSKKKVTIQELNRTKNITLRLSLLCKVRIYICNKDSHKSLLAAFNMWTAVQPEPTATELQHHLQNSAGAPCKEQHRRILHCKGCWKANKWVLTARKQSAISQGRNDNTKKIKSRGSQNKIK